MFASVSALASPVKADLTSRFTSSVQLQVNAAATQMQRIGSSFSITGNNVDTTDGTTANTVSAVMMSRAQTGDPEIDANIKKATDAKSKARKLKTLLGKKA